MSKRAIQFRAWRKRDREMTYAPNLMIDAQGIVFWQFGYDAPAPVDQDDYIIMQYTGVDDADSTRIFEGDIVNSTWGGVGGHHYRVVTRDDETKQLRFMPETGATLCRFNGDIFKVTGNIYEHPERAEGVSDE